MNYFFPSITRGTKYKYDQKSLCSLYIYIYRINYHFRHWVCIWKFLRDVNWICQELMVMLEIYPISVYETMLTTILLLGAKKRHKITPTNFNLRRYIKILERGLLWYTTLESCTPIFILNQEENENKNT